jgi:hypothetical protein
MEKASQGLCGRYSDGCTIVRWPASAGFRCTSSGGSKQRRALWVLDLEAALSGVCLNSTQDFLPANSRRAGGLFLNRPHLPYLSDGVITALSRFFGSR